MAASKELQTPQRLRIGILKNAVIMLGSKAWMPDSTVNGLGSGKR
jgi:hypothetical protein